MKLVQFGENYIDPERIVLMRYNTLKSDEWITLYFEHLHFLEPTYVTIEQKDIPRFLDMMRERGLIE